MMQDVHVKLNPGLQL